MGRLGNALCFQGVAVATLRAQNVLRRSSEDYKTSEETAKAYYLVIDVGSMGKKQERLIKLKNEAARRRDPLSDLEFVDAQIKPSPSKR